MSNKPVKIPRWGFVLAICLLIGFGGLGLYYYFTLQTTEAGFTAGSTDALFTIKDYALGIETDETDDCNVSVYGVDISLKTAQEIEDLVFADYTLLDTIQSGKSFEDLDDDYSYWCKAQGTGFDSQWFQPIVGENVILMMNSTEDVSILCYSTPAFSTAVNTTDYRNWVVKAVTLDAAESTTAKATSLEGYLPYYDFETNNDFCVVIRLTFNTTAATSFAEVEAAGAEVNEIASGVYLYYEIDAALLGSAEYDVALASTIGTSFEIVSIAIGSGDADSMTVWDSQ